jgi:hypothetical protein
MAQPFSRRFGLSVCSGHFRSSVNGKALSQAGVPLPWYTYPAIDFLTQRDFRGRSVLEFGGGQSTNVGTTSRFRYNN